MNIVHKLILEILFSLLEVGAGKFGDEISDSMSGSREPLNDV